VSSLPDSLSHSNGEVGEGWMESGWVDGRMRARRLWGDGVGARDKIGHWCLQIKVAGTWWLQLGGDREL
jgi:hypothetical protein